MLRRCGAGLDDPLRIATSECLRLGEEPLPSLLVSETAVRCALVIRGYHGMLEQGDAHMHAIALRLHMLAAFCRQHAPMRVTAEPVCLARLDVADAVACHAVRKTLRSCAVERITYGPRNVPDSYSQRERARRRYSGRG